MPDINIINQQPENSHPTTPPLRGKALAYATLDWIKANPGHWDQMYWHCGTSHCFAGVAEMLGAGLDPTQEHPERELTEDGDYAGPETINLASAMLGIGSRAVVLSLFSSTNTLQDLENKVAIIFGARNGITSNDNQ